MEIGTDQDGRSITYDEASGSFSIGGIRTTVDRIVAYDRGNQITWVSDDIRAWAFEYDNTCKAQAARDEQARAYAAAEETATRNQSAQRALLTARGYEPSTIVGFAGTLKGIATTLTVILTLVGVVEGFLVGAILAKWFPMGVLIMPVIFGAAGFLLAYLVTLMLRVFADLLLSVVQIEMNTRSTQ